MTRVIREILMQADPDMVEVLKGAEAMIRDAYDRGVISWERRCALLDGDDATVLHHYSKPHPDPEVDCYGVFAEIAPALVAEIAP